jgi:exonuclease III
LRIKNTFMAATMPRLLIASWNVAGWDATLKYIREHYKSLDAFLERHGFDVLAVQEVKLTHKKVQADPTGTSAYPFGAWESFWALPQSETTADVKRGFNGVTTYARTGLTLAANAAPLGDPSLDAEGRCLLTDHGGFVLLNVYAHSTGGAADGDEGAYQDKCARKLAFLAALRRKIGVLRAAGRHVILAGDLNIAARGADVPWRQSLLPVAALKRTLELGGGSGRGGSDAEIGSGNGNGGGEGAAVSDGTPSPAERVRVALAQLHMVLGTSGCETLCRALPTGGVRGVLSTASVQRAVEALVQGHNPVVLAEPAHTGDDDGDGDGEQALEGKGDRASSSSTAATAPTSPSTPAAAAAAAAAVAEMATASASGASGGAHSPRGSLGGSRGAGASEAERLATIREALRTLAHYIGVSPSQKDCVAWLSSLRAEGMVDAFAALRPHARARFTCWHQYTNMRYTNNGRRIDAFWVDAALMEHALPGAPLLEDESTEQGALKACTAGGRWLPAPTHGVLHGLQEARQTTHDLQFAPAHTGIVYTAPPASDHVAVTLLLEAVALGRSLPWATASGASSAGSAPPPLKPPDAPTKASVFRPPQSLKAFFAPRPKPPPPEPAVPSAAPVEASACGGAASGAKGNAAANAGDALVAGSVNLRSAAGSEVADATVGGKGGAGGGAGGADAKGGDALYKRPRVA